MVESVVMVVKMGMFYEMASIYHYNDCAVKEEVGL